MSLSLKRYYDGPAATSSRPSKFRRFNNTPQAMTFSGRSNTSYRSGRATLFKRKGPYRALVSGTRHTHPVYPKPELKIYDADHAGVSPPATAAASITNTGTVVCVNQQITGTGVANFIGNQASIKSVAYRFEVDLGATPVATSGRVILIWDRQPNGAVPTFTTIFASASYLAFGNVNTRERFVVLRNDQFSLSPNGDQTLFFERFVPINMTTTFTNAQASPAVPITGALLLVYIADQGTVANQPTIAGWIRVRYYDN